MSEETREIESKLRELGFRLVNRITRRERGKEIQVLIYEGPSGKVSIETERPLPAPPLVGYSEEKWKELGEALKEAAREPGIEAPFLRLLLLWYKMAEASGDVEKKKTVFYAIQKMAKFEL